MSKANNPRWTESDARKALQRAQKGGLSDSALARELGVSPQRVHWWRKRLGGAHRRPEPAFVEVTLAAPPRSAFAVHTKSGRTIEVAPGFDAAELVRLIAAVESSC